MTKERYIASEEELTLLEKFEGVGNGRKTHDDYMTHSKNSLATFCCIPTLIIGVFKYLHIQIKENRSESKALKSGIQALLRAQMISEYNKWWERGYAPIYARENFENCWRQYHSLGVNGVMDDIHAKFLQLPTEPHKEER